MTDNNPTAGQQHLQPTQPQQVNRVAMKPPPFWKSEPKLWFIQLEAQFSIAGITCDSTKYNYVISAIDTEILMHVTDFVTSPPSTDKYEGIKNKLTGIYADSSEKNLRKLLSDLDLGDRKPSHLLSEMTRLGGTSVTQELLKSLWMQRLPSHTQAILAMSEDQLPKLAQMADKITEIHQPQTFAVAANHATDDLALTIEKLGKQVEELRTSFQRQSRHRHRSRSRPPNRGSAPVNNSSGVCWYHRKFKEQARKCSTPCKHFGTTSAPQGNEEPRL